MSKQKLLAIGTLAALCLLAAFSLHARAAAQEGMVVVRDPQTGKMRAPTSDELKELRARTPAAAAARGAREPNLVSRPDGARGVRLGEKNMVYDVVTRGPDGKLTSQCVQGEAGVDKALGQGRGHDGDREDGHDQR